MAHRILGIDLGSYSIKIAVVRAGLRQTSVAEWIERAVPAGDEPLETRQLDTLAAVLREARLEHDIPHLALPGDMVSMRVLEFPFASIKRPDLEKAVGGELEGQLPHDLEELVFGFDVLPRETPAEGQKPAGTRVLAAACEREKLGAFLTAMQERQIPVHSVMAAPPAIARVVERVEPTLREQPVLVVDCGHLRSNACVVWRGRPLFARTVSRGGKQITQAIAKAWSLGTDEAEQAKHTDGFVASPGEPAQTEAWARVSDVIKRELGPLVQGLRQTIGACRAQTGVAPVQILLCGGGSRLRGLAAYLGTELDLPATTMATFDAARVAGLGGVPNLPVELAAPALGIALEAATGRPAFDLRQGAFSYRADYSFLRKRAGFLGACVLVLAAFAAGNAYASLYKLKKEAQILDKRLAQETTEVFGSPHDLTALEDKLHPKKDASPLPKMTAFDILVDLSRRLPDKTLVKLDVLELDIDPKRVFIKAIADTEAAIDLVEKKLKEEECFSEVKRGNVDSMPDGKQLTWTITNKCM